MTQYPAEFMDQVGLFNPDLRLNEDGSTRGELTNVYALGHWRWKPDHGHENGGPMDDFVGLHQDVGSRGSNYVGLLFFSATDAGPAPYPKKWLVPYPRAHNIQAGGPATIDLPVELGWLACANEEGDLVVSPGQYKFTVDINATISFDFEVMGEPLMVDTLAKRGAYNFTVPVYPG
ncbi:hypothetical protein KC315_g7367 [Hortaea werneckii]|nr:hypothetical protein KC315_g7367 [Hortaea werneckii]